MIGIGQQILLCIDLGVISPRPGITVTSSDDFLMVYILETKFIQEVHWETPVSDGEPERLSWLPSISACEFRCKTATPPETWPRLPAADPVPV